MSIIRATEAELTRYDLGGEIIARARLTDAGWVISDRDGCESAPIGTADEAQAQLAEWSHAAAAGASLGRAVEAYRRARQALEEAIRRAFNAGVPQTQIARISGFSRQWIRHLLQR